MTERERIPADELGDAVDRLVAAILVLAPDAEPARLEAFAASLGTLIAVVLGRVTVLAAQSVVILAERVEALEERARDG